MSARDRLVVLCKFENEKVRDCTILEVQMISSERVEEKDGYGV